MAKGKPKVGKKTSYDKAQDKRLDRVISKVNRRYRTDLSYYDSVINTGALAAGATGRYVTLGLLPGDGPSSRDGRDILQQKLKVRCMISRVANNQAYSDIRVAVVRVKNTGGATPAYSAIFQGNTAMVFKHFDHRSEYVIVKEKIMRLTQTGSGEDGKAWTWTIKIPKTAQIASYDADAGLVSDLVSNHYYLVIQNDGHALDVECELESRIYFTK